MKNNDNFVRIKTFFTSDVDRTVEELAKIYKDSSLQHNIKDILGESFLQEINGKNILINPNWVMHSLTETDDICLRTHENILLSTIEVILEQSPKKIIVGDAPINVCDWSEMLKDSFYSKIENLISIYNISIKIMDFRRFTFNSEMNIVSKNQKPLSEYVIFDLGEKSYLEPISKKKKSGFRVTNYDPDRLADSHKLGVHKYCITKELFDVDIVLSMPKIKTHQKTGLTGALKNLVGLNGDKDFLPHHRVGGVGFGGDCYPGKNIFRRISEYLLDKANRKMEKKIYKLWTFLSYVFWRISNPEKVHQLAAGWYGNDTCWRMVMDLNLIAEFGTRDGLLSNRPKRKIFSLCDGIIGGQGNGPLSPDPLALGVLIFTDNSAMNDICMGYLMDFDINKILLLKNAKKSLKNKNIIITLDGQKITESELSKYSISTNPPPGWVDYLKEL